MSQDRLLFASLGLLAAMYVGGCGSDPVDPITTENTSGTTMGGTAGPTAGTVTGTTGGTTTGATAATSVGGSTGTAIGTTTGTATTTSGSTTSGVAGSSTVTTGAATTTDAGTTTASTTMGTGGTGAVMCNTTISGEDFFKNPNECSLCHGEDALGVDPDSLSVPGGGPEVRHPDPEYTRWLLRNGREDHPDFPEGMAAYDDCILSDQMIEEIIVFLNSFPQPTDGAGLYNDYCANCHGADGRGGVSTRGLAGETGETGMLIQSGTHLGEYELRNEFMPVIDLTQEELNMVMDYMQNTLGL